jgi:hypothetical protein
MECGMLDLAEESEDFTDPQRAAIASFVTEHLLNAMDELLPVNPDGVDRLAVLGHVQVLVDRFVRPGA